jgi:hypothetical protein
MDHFLEDGCEFGENLDAQFWRKVFPDVSGIG